jgi:hypothetical protein
MLVVRVYLGSKYNREHSPTPVPNGLIAPAADHRRVYSVVEL